MLASVSSAVLQGVEGLPVAVEVYIANGLPSYNLVGLPDNACRESRDRVRAAISSSGFKWPNRKITINLAPAGLRKEGAALDVPIALAVLVASKQVPPEAIANVGAIGELGLDGSIRTVPAVVCLAGAIDAPAVFVPCENGRQAAAVCDGDVRCNETLGSLIASLVGLEPLAPVIEPDGEEEEYRDEKDFADVLGQPMVRWALEVAAAGGHHLLMVGTPGSGKTMLANRLVGLLPDLDAQDALAVTKIHSAAGLVLPAGGLVKRPPFRAPHHGVSPVAMIGGGTRVLRPGEISMAHGGVLFLDELGEYPVKVIDALRQPLEEGVVRISRAVKATTMPSRCLLVAAMNPCPCGEGGATGRCRCSDAARARYSRRLSGPVLDRFDLRVEVQPPTPELLFEPGSGESSEVVRVRVAKARQKALARGVRSNAELTSSQLQRYAPLTDDAKALLRKALENGSLTGRGLKRVRSVACTIADLLGTGEMIDADVASSALGLRASLPSILGRNNDEY